uniref:Transglutaminase elicitor n=1 Tax=Hyaloperonospora arabidopsidis (strain Emoy2) TaxID=559515 RepID=M4BIS8_HYAAE
MSSTLQYLSASVVARGATFAGLLLSTATATPFANNPVTIVESSTSLSHDSPAFSGIAAGFNENVLTYTVVEYTFTSEESSNSSSYTTNATTTSPDGDTSTTSTTQSQSSASTKQSADFKSSIIGIEPVLANVHDRKLEASTSDLQKLENYFQVPLELNVSKLALSAAYHVMPWPSSYWAMYLDSINYRWSTGNGPSATEKYATAFGIDPSAMVSKVSQSTGVISKTSLNTSCLTNGDCLRKGDGSVCARLGGETQGLCIPTWFGICHAWAPASLLEPEPNCAVEYNGVTFQPMDIKALITEVYDGAKVATVFTGARFFNPAGAATTDKYGRFTDASRRDLGPGFMHVALANIIGRFNASVVLDVSAGAEVWNQPIYSYEVLTKTELTPSDAASQYFGEPAYPFNRDAKRIMYVETKVSWMKETFENGGLVASGRAPTYMEGKVYNYLLELDDAYNILGGEWVGESRADHPDFLWLPKARPDISTVTEVGLSYRNVRTLLDMATSCS